MVRNPLLYDLHKSFKVLDQLKNLISVWNCVEMELSSVSLFT